VKAPTALPLDFRTVDDLAFAVARNRDIDAVIERLVPDALGPLVELQHLALPGYERVTWENLSALKSALSAGRSRLQSSGSACGLLRATADELDWTAFAIDAKRSATSAGLPDEWAAGMVAAIGELRSNIIEHCGAVPTGVMTFAAKPGRFEFTVSDQGIGVLATLREAGEYAALTHHGEALRLALTEGASRYGGGEGRGYGFKPLFVGLANRQAALRFRTGDAALVIDGTSPSLMRAQMGHKAPLQGFFVSVACTVTAPSR
jgi:hypothetical protein